MNVNLAVLLYSIVIQTITNRVADSTINDDTENIYSSSRNFSYNWTECTTRFGLTSQRLPTPETLDSTLFNPVVVGGELSVVLCSIDDAALAITPFHSTNIKKKHVFLYACLKFFREKHDKLSAGLGNLVACCNFNEKSAIMFTTHTYFVLLWFVDYTWWLMNYYLNKFRRF